MYIDDMRVFVTDMCACVGEMRVHMLMLNVYVLMGALCLSKMGVWIMVRCLCALVSVACID